MKSHPDSKIKRTKNIHGQIQKLKEGVRRRLTQEVYERKRQDYLIHEE